MFRTVFLSIIRSSRLYIQHQVYFVHFSWLLASGLEIEHLVPASKQSINLCDIHDAGCTVLNSWWWTERPSKTCRAILNKLENCASSWFYYRYISRCTVPWTSNSLYFYLIFYWRFSWKSASIFHLNLGCPTLFWQRATAIMVSWFACHTCKNHLTLQTPSLISSVIC
jgi:hypothetical protein